ncbi:hypothetical protein N7455_009271 [Penicillium solitum]|jgi:hypothetical protein|uniref:Genomic scaffold, ProqFM164S03 n=1 Tax=Penicillium roqueforti (strain FM164) TaxID=1365484 RepID=W6QA75_PENRF|nr:hypothetical protein N7455_009271 [Penicillium solitum]CDM33280.1 unnamed protein product [Penicillium roqueforti FM164]
MEGIMTTKNPFSQQPSISGDPMAISSLLNDQTLSSHQYPRPSSHKTSQGPGSAMFRAVKLSASSVQENGTHTKSLNLQDQEQDSFSDRQARSSNPIKCGITKNETPPRHRLSQKVYNKEETHFIWFHRVILRDKWPDVLEKFSRQFPSRPRRSYGGLEGRLRRFLQEETLSSSQKKNQGWKYGGKGGQAISYTSSEGVVHICTYPWMQETAGPQSKVQSHSQKNCRY